MTAQEFAQIKQKIEGAKQSKARAEGALSKIGDQLKKDFSITDVKEADAKIKELNSEIETDKGKLEKMYNKLESTTDWEAVE